MIIFSLLYNIFLSIDASNVFDFSDIVHNYDFAIEYWVHIINKNKIVIIQLVTMTNVYDDNNFSHSNSRNWPTFSPLTCEQMRCIHFKSFLLEKNALC